MVDALREVHRVLAPRAILIDAFLNELIEGIDGQAARAYFRRACDSWLAKGSQP